VAVESSKEAVLVRAVVALVMHLNQNLALQPRAILRRGAHGLPGDSVQSAAVREFSKEPVLALEVIVREIQLSQNHVQPRVGMLHFNGWVLESAHQTPVSILTVSAPLEEPRPSAEELAN